MKKYLYVLRNTILEFFAYRLNFLLWRVRAVVSILITYFLWKSVFMTSRTVLGYSESRMLTYIIVMITLSGIVFSTQTQRVASEINQGDLSNFLIRPINFFKFNFAREAADKIVNCFFSLVETFLLIVILKPSIIIQTDVNYLLFFLVAVILSSFLYFEISIILSFIGFWSHEVWAPRFLFFILVSFLSGTYFPLDIFPGIIYNFLKLLPFTYLIFFPLKVYLGELNYWQLWDGFFITMFWIIYLLILMIFLWKKGLKAYTSEGR